MKDKKVVGFSGKSRDRLLRTIEQWDKSVRGKNEYVFGEKSTDRLLLTIEKWDESVRRNNEYNKSRKIVMGALQRDNEEKE